MLVSASELPDRSVLFAPVTVIGAGAAGIAIALALAERGVEVNLIESGHESFDERVQALADTDGNDPDVHPPMSECTRRQIGGTSAIWGGRVVPFDEVDFDERPHVPHSRWPIGFTRDVQPYYRRVCEFLLAGEPTFDIRSIPGIAQHTLVPGLNDAGVTSSTLERWSVINAGKVYANRLKDTTKIKLIHGLTCTQINCEKGSRTVSSVTTKAIDGRTVTLKSRRFILACGGLNATRLLMASDRNHPGGIGNHSGLLGRFYIGHISGRLAEVRFSTDPRKTIFGFDRDRDGTYLRRRLAFTREFQREHQLPNIVSWLVNPEISDPVHGNGVLSFAYLALTSPFGKYFASEAIRKAAVEGEVQGPTSAHVMNMLRDLPRTAVFIPTFGYKRFLAKRKVPGFFQYSRGNSYTLHYFGEQMPNPDSRVTLSEKADELGLRRLKLEPKYTAQDYQNVVRAHELWDEHLRRTGVGELKYVVKDKLEAAAEQAGDGFHQVGTTRMSDNPSTGVVDAQCRVHGLDDLYVASSSSFVTAGQANSMFMILVLALRVADTVAGEVAGR